MRERTPFPAELLKQLPNLKLLLTTGRRNRAIDLDTCKERGILVVGSAADKDDKPKVFQDSTVQHTVAMILAIAGNLAQDDASVKAGGWQTSPSVGLPGKTLGALGLGNLGSAAASILHRSFGMKVIAWSANLTQEKADEAAKRAGLPVETPDGDKTFKAVSKDELFRTADVVTIHLVLSDRSRGIVSQEDLSKMKQSSFLVNTSRGPLIVENDILETLRAGRIRGAALDVFEVEPLPADSPWRSKDWGKDGKSKVLLTPHMGYVEDEKLHSWYDQQVEDLEKWAGGETTFANSLY